jgi:hypothetical protein
MKVIGILTVSILSSLALIGLNMLSGNGFIFSFINEHAFDISTTLLGFNIAIHTILIGQITNIEKRNRSYWVF